jgi:hypothetical protein
VNGKVKVTNQLLLVGVFIDFINTVEGNILEVYFLLLKEKNLQSLYFTSD